MIASTQTNHPLAQVKAPAAKAQTPLDVALARLKAAGLRITQPRIAILETMLRLAGPTPIEQIHKELADASCDLVTVYRCLAVFEDLGLVRRSFLHNGTAIYELTLDGAQHYHVVCKATNKVAEVDAATAAEIHQAVKHVEDILRARGFTEVTHIVEFFALSPEGARLRAASPEKTVAA